MRWQDEKDTMEPYYGFIFSYYLGEILPNKARSIIENGIAKIMDRNPLTNKGQHLLKWTARAMVRIDPVRAVQIARRLLVSSELSKGRNINFRAEVSRKLAQYLLATEEARRDLF